MHTLQPTHTKISSGDAEKVLDEYNISITQLPKISRKDPALSDDCNTGDVIKIQRGDSTYFRVVI